MLLTHELEMTFPEGFHEMGPEELSGLQFIAEGPGVCLKDPERHVVVSVGWKQIGAFAGLMLNTKDIAGNMEKTIRKAMEPFRYEAGKSVERRIGGETARGISFSYTAAGDIGMAGESLAMKRGKTIYYLHFYTRREMEEENRRIWEEILNQTVFN